MLPRVAGGSGVSLTASGGATYSWSPAATLSASTGATVTATPTTTTTYTVTVTSAAGCTATATAVVTVSPAITATATATPTTICSGSNSQLQATASVPTTYTLSSITPAIIPVAGATNGPSGDDEVSSAITLPFTFNFFGTNYTQFYISTNGFISFTSLSGFGSSYAQTLPSTTTPNNIVALSMSDLNAQVAGIRYFTSGTAPNRIFVIDFTAVPFYSLSTTTTGSVTGQIQLYETSNRVEIHVSSVNHGTSTATNTLGIENSTGTVGYAPAGRNGVVWNAATPEAYRFIPATGTFTYSWSPTSNLNDATIANPLAANVTATTTYTVTVTETTSGCTKTASTTVTVLTAAPTAVITPAAPSICAGASITLTASGGGTYSWSTGATTAAITGSPTETSTYTVTVTDICGLTGTTSATVTVNPLPAAAITPTSTVTCPGSGSISLTATGGGTYSWSPAVGLSGTTGATVTANPAITTTYTVTVTSANGCTATATTVITIAPVIGATATATPATICSGGGSQLQAIAATTATYNLTTTIPFLITVPGGATNGPTGDDGVSSAIALPFTFSYFGNNYSQLYISTNGYLAFNDPALATASQQRTAQTFPSPTVPNNIVALSMADLNATSGQIKYFVSGTAPNRIFVVNFNAVPFFSAAGNVTGQIHLHETSNLIEVHVGSVNHGTATYLNTLGIENATGTVGYAPPNRNNVLWNAATPEAGVFNLQAVLSPIAGRLPVR